MSLLRSKGQTGTKRLKQNGLNLKEEKKIK